MQFIQGSSRTQTYFATMEDHVSADNAVRLMDAFVDKLDLFLRMVSPKICVLAGDIAVSLVKIMRIVITVAEPQRPIALHKAWVATLQEKKRIE